MLGVFGCVPVYDRFLMKGLRYYRIAQSGIRKFISLYEWIKENPDFIEDLQKIKEKYYFNKEVEYPFMKLLDTYFWELGRKLEKEQKVK